MSRPQAGAATSPRSARGRRTGNPAEMVQALDSMRVFATVAVVFYHAGLAYLTRPMRLTLWPVYDASHHSSVDYFVYWVNAFAMPLFFMAAGVSAPSGIESRGLRVFLTHRVKRLLRPMVVGSFLLLLMCYQIWGYGLMRRGIIDLDNIMSWRFPPRVAWHLYGLGHFWFLEYLFLVCVIWGVGWTVFQALSARLGGGETLPVLVDRALASPWRGLWLALPTAIIFLLDTDTIIRVDNRILPNGLRLLHYTYFFLAGGWLSRVPEPKKTLGPLGPTYLALSGLVFAAMSPFLMDLAAAPLQGPERIAMALLGASFSWLFVLGCLGTLLRLVEGKGPVMRYLSESSFWVYLFHLPIVALMQMVLEGLRMPCLVKLPLIGSISLALSLVTYELSIRYSFLGEWINGARKRTARWGWRGLGPEFGAIAGLSVLLLCYGGVFVYFRTFLFQSNFHEVAAGKVYRSARVSPGRLDELVRAHGIKAVIAFGGLENQAWFDGQVAVCRESGVEYRHVKTLRTERLPSRPVLAQLVDFLENVPRPVLVEGYRGIDQCGLASAIALMLDGTDPDVALKQFHQRYGQFGGAEHSYLGMALVDYRLWLARNRLAHSPEHFKSWVRTDYLVSSTPQVPEELRQRFPQVATAPEPSSVVR
jgi:peptidoglycan/LPS O-acetylase OafA/YrhL